MNAAYLRPKGMYVRHGTKRARVPRKRRTSENSVLGEVRRIYLLRGWVNRTRPMCSASRSSIMPVGKGMISPGFSRRVGKDHYGVYSDSRTARGGGVRGHLGPHQRPVDGPKCPIR